MWLLRRFVTSQLLLCSRCFESLVAMTGFQFFEMFYNMFHVFVFDGDASHSCQDF